MLKRLIRRLGLMPRTIERDELLDLLTAMVTEGKTNIIDSLKDIEDLDPKLFNKKALSFLYGKLGKARDPKTAVQALIKVNEDLFAKENDIRTLLSELPEVITTQHTTVKIGAICNMVNDLSTFINYQMDFIYLLVTDAKQDNLYSKSKLKEIWAGVPTFVTMLSFVSNLDQELKLINNYDNSIIINEGNKSSISLLKDTKLSYLPADGLIQTIYSIRVWLVDREIKKYELLKEKKTLIEMRVLELKKQSAGDPTNTQISKAIDTMTEEIEKTEYKIKKIEKL